MFSSPNAYLAESKAWITHNIQNMTPGILQSFVEHTDFCYQCAAENGSQNIEHILLKSSNKKAVFIFIFLFRFCPKRQLKTETLYAFSIVFDLRNAINPLFPFNMVRLCRDG